MNITCIGHPALVHHMSIGPLIKNNVAKLADDGTLYFSKPYIKIEYDKSIYVLGPLNKQGYKAGSKTSIDIITLPKNDKINYEGDVLGGDIVIGGGAINNAKILSNLLTLSKVNLLLGTGPGLPEEKLREATNAKGFVKILPTWSISPIYIEIDLAPFVSDSVVLKPNLSLTKQINYPNVDLGDLCIINTIYDTKLLFYAMHELGNLVPGVVAMTLPLQSSRKLSLYEKFRYQEVFRENIACDTIKDFSIRSSFSKANSIVVNETEAQNLFMERQNSSRKTISNLIFELNDLKSINKSSISPKIYLTLGEYGCLMLGKENTLHYCYACPGKIANYPKHTYALGDAFTAGIFIAELKSVQSGCSFPEIAGVSLGVTVATAALLYGYNNLSWDKIDTIIKAGAIKYFYFESKNNLEFKNAFSYQPEELNWDIYNKLPAKTIEHDMLLPFFREY